MVGESDRGNEASQGQGWSPPAMEPATAIGAEGAATEAMVQPVATGTTRLVQLAELAVRSSKQMGGWAVTQAGRRTSEVARGAADYLGTERGRMVGLGVAALAPVTAVRGFKALQRSRSAPQQPPSFSDRVRTTLPFGR